MFSRAWLWVHASTSGRSGCAGPGGHRVHGVLFSTIKLLLLHVLQVGLTAGATSKSHSTEVSIFLATRFVSMFYSIQYLVL